MRILLATDGSRYSRDAERVLEHFPFAQPPAVIVATACPSADLHALGADVSAGVNDLVDRCRRESERLLADVAGRCLTWARSVETQLLDGHAANEILKLAEAQKPDLIVVGARGLGALSRVVLGSVSERIVKHAPCSVLVVRVPDDDPRLLKTLFGLDNSPVSQKLLERFSSFRFGPEHSIELQCVIEQFLAYGMELSAESEGIYARERQNALKLLEDAAHRLSPACGLVTTHVHMAPDVADNIIDTAHKHGTDLIAVGSTGKNSLQRFLLGSVSVRLLHHAPCSLWIER